VRRWLKRAALVAIALAALWLLVVNVALNTPPLLSALNRRPDRFRLEWSAAWCVVPGRVHVHGLRLESRASRTGWAMEVDRAFGRIDLRALTDRTLRLRELHGEGVRSDLFVRREEPAPRRAAAPNARRRAPWRFAFDSIELRHVRQVRFSGLRLTGDSTAAGALLIVPGREVKLERARFEMADAQLRQGSRVLVSRLRLAADAELGPYAPREHRGLGGWDFLTGSLTAKGEVDDLPLVDRVRATGSHSPGALTAGLRVERGRLLPGSAVRLTAPGSAGDSTFSFTGTVEGQSDAPLLRLLLEARGIVGGRSADRPPTLRVDALSLSTTSAETRVRSLITVLRTHRRGATGDAPPLLADARAEGVRIDAPSSRLVAHAVLDRLAGRIDAGALLAREVAVEGLEVDGASVRFDLAAGAPPKPGHGEPWAVRLDGVRVAGLREVAIGDIAVIGVATATGSFALDRAGTLQVPRVTLAMPAGRLDVAGQPAAHDLAVELEATVEPVPGGPSRRPQLIHASRGRASLRGSVTSLGFLAPYLQRTPWLGIQGKGAFTAELAVDHGRFAIGSRLAVRGDPVTATLLASRATGRGTVEVTIEAGPTQPRTALRVRFERFDLADARRPRQAPYLRGRGLRIAAIAPEAVDLASPLQDFDATVDLADGELPDLAVYDALLPAEAGLSLRGGRGRAQLHLQASTATRRATGNLVVTAGDARFRFQNVDARGRLALRAPLRTADLTSNRYDLAGARLELEDIAYEDAAGTIAGAAGWWARAELTKAALAWGDPLALRGTASVRMKDSGPLLALFANKSRLVRWFDEALRVEGVEAQAAFRLDRDLVQIDSLDATAATRDVELRSRMRFSKAQRRGDLYVRYGRLAAGVALRDGRRDLVLRHPLEWFSAGAARPFQ
jgi:hypothetical protein